MKFGVYVHIPYCIQRCRYCDFTTFEFSEIMDPKSYVELIVLDIQNRSHLFIPQDLTSLYFGGGTPSLLEPKHILTIINELANHGFKIGPETEVTIEINPATMDKKNLEFYLKAGINRFSVGAQSFSDPLLKMCGRKHSAKDTRYTLDTLREFNLNYSFDLLFGLPNQTLDDLKVDLEEVNKYKPPHLSAYCLTVPEGHPMSYSRPSEDTQIEMFDLIETELLNSNLFKYEISNFSQPGLKSRHNLLYWTDQAFWGIGLSAHSYLPNIEMGVRFSNSKIFNEYIKQVKLNFNTDNPWSSYLESNVEKLKAHEALTDFCHTSFRLTEGLMSDLTINKFGENVYQQIILPKLFGLETKGLITKTPSGFKLTSNGEKLSNLVFLDLTFEDSDLNEFT